jgi:hypothetical protein
VRVLVERLTKTALYPCARIPFATQRLALILLFRKGGGGACECRTIRALPVAEFKVAGLWVRSRNIA